MKRVCLPSALSKGFEVFSTILIVEDHAAVRKSLCDWLRVMLPDCEFVEAQSGEEAMSLTDAQPPDLVLMDIGLPGMTGIEATRRIKAIAPKTLVVILSIHEEEAYQLDAATAGASAFVSKRTMQTKLVPVIKTLLLRGEIRAQVAG
jgi:two-component system invasion response regulator UvrY